MRALAILLLLFSCQPAYATCLHDCHVDDAGYILIKTAEGYSPFVYKDSAGVPTVGFGHAILPGEQIHTPLMGPDALDLLQRDVSARTAKLNHIITAPLAAEQFDALASFAYNVGIGNLQRSTLLKRVNAQENKLVHPQFLVWDHAGGRMLTGLKIRREAEAELYDEGLSR